MRSKAREGEQRLKASCQLFWESLCLQSKSQSVYRQVQTESFAFSLFFISFSLSLLDATKRRSISKPSSVLLLSQRIKRESFKKTIGYSFSDRVTGRARSNGDSTFLFLSRHKAKRNFFAHLSLFLSLSLSLSYSLFFFSYGAKKGTNSGALGLFRGSKLANMLTLKTPSNSFYLFLYCY